MTKAESCILCKDHCAARIPLFKNLDCRELIEVVKTVGRRKYKKGEVIFEEGDKCNSLYFINEGKVKLYKYTKDGKEQILSILGKNDFVGDLDLLNISEHKYNAAAVEDCKMCIITKDEMRTIMLNNPEIGIKVLEAVSEKMSAMENLIQNLATNDADTRVAYLLNELAETYGQKEGTEIVISDNDDKVHVFYIMDEDGTYKFALKPGTYNVRFRFENQNVVIVNDVDINTEIGFLEAINEKSNIFRGDKISWIYN